MIEITKDERDVISDQIPEAHVVRTMKQKSRRHHYYCEESTGVMQILARLRNGDGYTEAGGGNGRRTKT